MDILIGCLILLFSFTIAAFIILFCKLNELEESYRYYKENNNDKTELFYSKFRLLDNITKNLEKEYLIKQKEKELEYLKRENTDV